MKTSKKSLKYFMLFVALFLSFTIQAQLKKTATVEGITEYQLDNGLKVLLFPDNSSQTITVNITYKVGSRHEGYGEKGMAHLLEHLVFKGTPNHPNISEELSSHGARANASTWYDRTNYYETFDATDENLEWALDLEADRMVNSYIAKKDLESEFSVVRNEFESSENNPTSVLMEKVINSAFLWHNYGQSTIGNRSDIERVPIDNLKAFYKKYYRPDNAVLMVTGKFNTENTLNLIEEKFGSIKKPEKPLPDSHTVEPPQDGEKWVNLSRVGDLQIVSCLYHIPAGSHEDYASLSIANEVISNHPSSRLAKVLIDTKKAFSLWSFAPFLKEPSFLYFNVDVGSDKSLEDAQFTFLKVLDEFKDNPITQEELDRAKAALLNNFEKEFRYSSKLGTTISEYIGAGDWRLIFIQRDRIEAMTLDKVNAAIKKYFIPTNRTVGQFIPTKTPERVEIAHTEDVDKLVKTYRGKKGYGTGEIFDVQYDNIQNRLVTGKMKCGIKYGFIKKDNRGKTVSIDFIIRNGDVNSLMNKRLVAGYTARILNKGTMSKTEKQIQDDLSKLKSSILLGGGHGYLHTTILSTEENLMKTLELMADMIKNPKFENEKLEKIKTIDLAVIKKSKTNPNDLAKIRLSLINQIYPKGHPYYEMTFEEKAKAIKDLKINDLKVFHKDFYGISNNASVVAVGNFDSKQLINFFEKEFGNFKSSFPYTRISALYRQNKIINENINTPDKKSAITLGEMFIELSKNDKDYPAMIIASEIFGGSGLNSRVAVRLRQKDGLSYGVSAGAYIGNDKNRSQLSIYANYAPQNADKIQLGFKEEIDRFINDGITEEELKSSVNGWIQKQKVNRAIDMMLSTMINNNIYYNRDMSFYKNIEEKVKSLTVKKVNEVIKKYFKPFDKWTVVNAGDFNK